MDRLYEIQKSIDKMRKQQLIGTWVTIFVWPFLLSRIGEEYFEAVCATVVLVGVLGMSITHIYSRRATRRALSAAAKGDHAAAFPVVLRHGSKNEIKLAFMLWLSDAVQSGDNKTALDLCRFAKAHISDVGLHKRIIAEESLIDYSEQRHSQALAGLTLISEQLPVGPLRIRVEKTLGVLGT